MDGQRFGQAQASLAARARGDLSALKVGDSVIFNHMHAIYRRITAWKAYEVLWVCPQNGQTLVSIEKDDGEHYVFAVENMRHPPVLIPKRDETNKLINKITAA